MISLFFIHDVRVSVLRFNREKNQFQQAEKRITKRSITTNNKVSSPPLPSSFNLLKTFAEDGVTRCVIHSPFKLMKVKTKKGENKKRERETNDTVDSAERKLQLPPTDWWIFSCFVCMSLRSRSCENSMFHLTWTCVYCIPYCYLAIQLLTETHGFIRAVSSNTQRERLKDHIPSSL